MDDNQKCKNSQLRKWFNVNEKRIKIVVYSILGVLVVFWLIEGRIEYVRFDREYFTDGYHCNAVVTRVTGILGSKPSNYYRHVNYKYEYQDVIYDGDCKIDDRHKMKVGDTIEVIVSRVNPEYSKLADPDFIRIL